jgi:hypothetical protein
MQNGNISRRHGSSWLLGLLLVVGCTAPLPTPPRFFLDVANVDGPPIAIEINGRVVGHIECQLNSGKGIPAVTPGPDLALPWTVRLVRADGSLFGRWVYSGAAGPRTIVIRTDGPIEGPSGHPVGPAPMPSATCPP